MMRGGGMGGHWGLRSRWEDDPRPISRKTVRRVLQSFRPYRGKVILTCVLITVTAAIGVVNPLLIAVVFDNALFPHKNGVALPPDIPLLWKLVGLMCLIPVINSVIGVGQTYITNLLGQRLMQEFREKLYVHLQGMSLHFFTSTRTGTIQSRLANDVGGIESVVTNTVPSILSNVVTIASTLIAMLILSWQLTVLSLGIMPIFMWFTHRVGRQSQVITRHTQESLSEMTAITQETLSVSGILLSKVFGRQQYEIQRFRKENDKLADLEVRQQMVGRYFFAFVQTFFSITPALVYLVAGLVVAGDPLHPAIQAGTIVAFTTLQSRLFFPLGQMLQTSVQVQGSLALFDRIFEYLDLPQEIQDRENPVVLSPKAVHGLVSFENVWFSYSGAARSAPERAREWALADINVEIQPGKLVALVGPSGAGKTTLTYLVPRLYDATRGRVTVDGTDVREIALKSLADIMGIVTQETYLFHATIRENLLYGKTGASEPEIEAAARSAFIHERIMQMPKGYDTMVGERGYRLSGGEKQRLAIARVVLKDPRILILDEATSSLDTTSERLVQDALAELMKGRTTIAIAHRLSTILAADQILVMDHGRIVERGTHAELVGAGGIYERLYREQFRSPEGYDRTGATDASPGGVLDLS